MQAGTLGKYGKRCKRSEKRGNNLKSREKSVSTEKEEKGGNKSMKRKEKMRIKKQGEDKGKAEGGKVKANEKEEK